uniref:Uncharacterized protein n=1 Tax=Ditylenchus dipsaci TaxID=166011 RepID=A0A915EDI0_9BILA
MDQILANYGSDASGSEEEQPIKSRKHKAYSTEWKLEVIKHAKKISNHSASKKCNIESQLKQLKESSTDGESSWPAAQLQGSRHATSSLNQNTKTTVCFQVHR